jgi:hypothetical protein
MFSRNLSRLQQLSLTFSAVALSTACGGGGGGGDSAPAVSVSAPAPVTPAPQGSVPTAFETCPASPAGAATAPVATTLDVQSEAGWNNTAGSLSAAANGTRNNREGGPSSALNCISWKDANNKARALNLGAYMFDYVSNDNGTRAVATDDADGHPGFGYVVSHNTVNGNSPLGSQMPATSVKTIVMAGANHAIHRVTMNYTRDTEAGGNGIVIPVVIEWMVAAGRSNPVWAVNYKMNQATKNAGVSFDTYKMDSRGPYGSIGWDGKTQSSGTSEAVTRVEWGAGGYRFVANQVNGVRNTSNWTYDTPDSVNYTRALAGSDLEFGVVQTALDKFMGYPDFVQGRITNSTFALYGDACADANSTTAGNQPSAMPCANAWPYQMMQFSTTSGDFGPGSTTGKLMAWGTPYGWLGASTLPSFDSTQNTAGTGERTYGTFIAWGRNGSAAAINDPVASAKAYADTASFYTTSAINGGFGTIATSTANLGGPTTRGLPTNGYNANYSAFEVNAATNKADVSYSVTAAAATPLVSPIVIFNNYSGAAPVLKWNGATLVSGTDYLASYDTQGQRLWITFLKTIAPNGATRVQLN